MKKLIFMTLTSTLILASSLGFCAEKDEEVKLYDGRVINLQKDVQTIHTYNNAIDFLELNDGEIVDRTDILEKEHKLNQRHDNLAKARGIDGGA
ncbi:MAG: hypothetical protein QF441_01170 [Bacteriovoracaceae bacterium]|jgi:choline kinase|nr:hypothetical protein [Bacteriovoracaceae bacterium]|tara:strand:- start:18 stop:299 length:282 start_codon:yes stop_codon:yes gene_type:complete